MGNSSWYRRGHSAAQYCEVYLSDIERWEGTCPSPGQDPPYFRNKRNAGGWGGKQSRHHGLYFTVKDTELQRDELSFQRVHPHLLSFPLKKPTSQAKHCVGREEQTVNEGRVADLSLVIATTEVIPPARCWVESLVFKKRITFGCRREGSGSTAGA